MAFGRFLLWGERITLVPLGGRVGIQRHGGWVDESAGDVTGGRGLLAKDRDADNAGVLTITRLLERMICWWYGACYERG